MLPVVLFLLASSQPARATPFAYEGFAMPLPHPFDGGPGFSGPWTGSGYYYGGFAWSDATLNASGLRTSGGSLLGEASSWLSYASRMLDPSVKAYSTVYVSFLLQPRGHLNEGAYNGFFGLLIGGTTNVVFAGKSGGGALDRYVLETQGGTGQFASSAPVVLGQPSLLVVKVQLTGGTDTFTLYVDPPIKSPEPASGTVKSDIDLGDLTYLGIFSSGSFAIDEIRLGTTFADVVPAKQGP
jgi:hypothetical protein